MVWPNGPGNVGSPAVVIQTKFVLLDEDPGNNEGVLGFCFKSLVSHFKVHEKTLTLYQFH